MSTKGNFTLRGVVHGSDLGLSGSLDEATAQILRDTIPPARVFGVRAVHAGDPCTPPADVPFATDVAALQTKAADAGRSTSEGTVPPLRGDVPGARADAASGETAAEPDGRAIVVEGLANNVWRMSVDGEVQDGTTVEVAPGDTVEWRVAGGRHGVTFQQWSDAEAFLAFAPDVGLPIEDQPLLGPEARGTAAVTGAGTVLARAEVQEQGTLDALEFICTFHGPGMNGTLQLAAAEPEGRAIVVEGLTNNVWRVSVDGEVQAGTTVEVAPGDTVEWRVAGGRHGVTFQQWSAAEAFLAFDPSVGLPIEDQPVFGPEARGTAPVVGAGTVLARAEVREQGTLDALEFICTLHGPGMNGTLQLAAAEPEGREIVVEGLANNVWRMTVDGEVQAGTTVEVAPGDTVEWRVAGGRHGVTFQQWSDAEAFLAFDPSVGLPIEDQPVFGPEARGTAPVVGAGTVLARAEVQEQGTLAALEFICTLHGPGMNGTLQLAAAEPVQRGMWLPPAVLPTTAIADGRASRRPLLGRFLAPTAQTVFGDLEGAGRLESGARKHRRYVRSLSGSGAPPL